MHDFFLFHSFEIEMNRAHNPLEILISENISQTFNMFEYI